MNKIKFDWPNILNLAQEIGMPAEKKRAILREYLQCHFLNYIYNQKKSNKLAFVGGTSLRLLHNLDRFSEDLDFDNQGLSTKELEDCFVLAAKKMSEIGFDNDWKFKKIREDAWRGYLKFTAGILQEIKLSPFQTERLMIKIEVMKPKAKINIKPVLLKRFGVLANIISYDLSIILSQKTLAALHRRPSKARDFYDVAWLLIQHIRPDFKILKKENIKNIKDYTQIMLKEYIKLKPNLKILKQKLKPFLINEENLKYLDLFDKIIQDI